MCTGNAVAAVLRYGTARPDRVRPGCGNDLRTAAHALSLTLVTANERELRRIKGLAVENRLAPVG